MGLPRYGAMTKCRNPKCNNEVIRKSIRATHKVFCQNSCRNSFNKKYRNFQMPLFKDPSEYKRIECLRCHKDFKAEGKFNKICNLCKKSHAFNNGVINYTVSKNGRASKV